MHYSPQLLMPIAIIGLILYRRIKRSIGFQPFKKKRLIIRIVLFSFITILFLVTSAAHPISYLYDLVGVMIGIIFVFYAMKHSSFEYRNDILFYRTHIWIESIILFLFLSRFLYRFVFIFNMADTQAPMTTPQNAQFIAKDPLTMIVFFIIAVYYIGFYYFVLTKSKTNKGE